MQFPKTSAEPGQTPQKGDITLKNDYEKLELILHQTATRWTIIKDVEEWLDGSRKELREMQKLVVPNPKIVVRIGEDRYINIKELLGES